MAKGVAREMKKCPFGETTCECPADVCVLFTDPKRCALSRSRALKELSERFRKLKPPQGGLGLRLKSGYETKEDKPGGSKD